MALAIPGSVFRTQLLVLAASILLAVPARAQNQAAFPEETAPGAAPARAAPPSSVAALPPATVVAEQRAAPPTAFLASSKPPAQLESKRDSGWYGAPILLLDALAITILLGTAVTLDDDGASSTQVLLGLGGTVLGLGGAGAVHNAHGHWVRSSGSFLLRGATISTGAIAGLALGNDCNERENDPCHLTPVLGGLALGIAAASVVDTALLAYDETPGGLLVTPVMSAGKDGGWLGATGRF